MLVIFPLTLTLALVIVPLVIVKLGGLNVGAPDMLAAVPAPAELTALTLKLCVPLESPVNVWLDMLWAANQEPLFRDTSYLVMLAPPLLVGADHLTVTWPTPEVTLRLLGAPGRLAGVVNVCMPL